MTDIEIHKIKPLTETTDQEWQYLAEQMDTNFENIQTGISTMHSELSNDIKTANDAIDELEASVSALDKVTNPLRIVQSADQLFQKGIARNVTISWQIKEGNVVVIPDALTINGEPVEATSTAKTFLDVTETTDYVIQATKNDVITTATVHVQFVGMSYYGIVAKDFEATDATIRLLQQDLHATNKFSMSGNLVAQKAIYAYEASLGDLVSIKDGNGLECIQAFDKTTVDIDSITYNVYMLTDYATANNVTFNFE